jgi:hypothetical protein
MKTLRAFWLPVLFAALAIGAVAGESNVPVLGLSHNDSLANAVNQSEENPLPPSKKQVNVRSFWSRPSLYIWGGAALVANGIVWFMILPGKKK